MAVPDCHIDQMHDGTSHSIDRVRSCHLCMCLHCEHDRYQVQTELDRYQVQTELNTNDSLNFALQLIDYKLLASIDARSKRFSKRE